MSDPSEWPDWMREDLIRRYQELAAMQVDLVMNAVTELGERVESLAESVAAVKSMGGLRREQDEMWDEYLGCARAQVRELRRTLIDEVQAGWAEQAEAFMRGSVKNDPPAEV